MYDPLSAFATRDGAVTKQNIYHKAFMFSAHSLRITFDLQIDRHREDPILFSLARQYVVIPRSSIKFLLSTRRNLISNHGQFFSLEIYTSLHNTKQNTVTGRWQRSRVDSWKICPWFHKYALCSENYMHRIDVRIIQAGKEKINEVRVISRARREGLECIQESVELGDYGGLTLWLALL